MCVVSRFQTSVPGSSGVLGGRGRSLALRGLGVDVVLEVSGDRAKELEGRLRAVWSRCLAGDPSGPPQLVARLLDEDSANPESLNRMDSELASRNLLLLLERISQIVTLELIKLRAGEVLMFHAGAVSHPVTGRSLVYVAESRTGKTTLSQVLGSAYGYLTDETVAVDEELRILPYPKPLSVRSVDLRERKETSPDELRLVPAHSEPRVERLVYLKRHPDADMEPRVQELDLFDAIELLTPQTSSLGIMDQGLHRLADLIERTGPVLQIDYSEAETLLPVAASLIGEAP